MTPRSSGSHRPGSGTILFGGSGFLGSHILKADPKIISVGRTDPGTGNRHVFVEALGNLEPLEAIEFDNVIFNVGHSDHYSLEKETLERGALTAFDYHVAPVIQVLEQLKSRGLRKFVHFSTVLLYDWKKISMPVSESDPIDPRSTRYVLSKHMAEEACRFYSRWIPIVNIRLANMYGPSPRQRYDIVHQLVVQLLTKHSGKVWTTRPSRDFIYVEDAARAVLQLMRTESSGDVNLGTGTATSVAEIVAILRAVSGFSIDDEDRQVNGPSEFRCDTTRLNSLIDWKPEYSIDQGLRRTYELMSNWHH